MELEAETALFLRHFRPTHPDILHSNLVVGVSGGIDSTALLAILHSVWLSGQLVVVHLHHGLRADADVDAGYVAELAASYNLPFFQKNVDVAELAATNGWTIEEAGRNARYQFFAEVAAQTEASFVAVAHTADDQAETVLMNLLRGTGLAGLRGMLPIRRMTETAAFYWLIRPFLQTSRTQIEDYCRAQQLTPRHDPSNLDRTFFRNQIRHDLLPQLESISPNIRGHLQQLAQITAADEAFLSSQCDVLWLELLIDQQPDFVSLRREGWVAAPLALRRRILRKGLRAIRPSLSDISFAAIEQARLLAEAKSTGQRASLPAGCWLQIAYDQIHLFVDGATLPVTLPQLANSEQVLTLPLPGRLDLGNGWLIEATQCAPIHPKEVSQNQDPWQIVVVLPPKAQLTVRTRRPGERFQPLGLQGHSMKVKDLMINRKIPARYRPLWPVVALDEHLVWVVGQQMDERVRVSAPGQQQIRLRCYRHQETTVPAQDSVKTAAAG